MRDWVELEGIEVDASVGILGWESRVRQPLRIDLRMGLDLEQAALSEQIRDTIDYGLVTSVVEALATEGHWWLIETLARTIAAAVLCAPVPCENRPQIAHAEVRIRKPKVLFGRAVPGVRLSRTAADFTLGRHASGPGVTAEPLHVGPHTSVVRLGLRPGAEVHLADHVALHLLGGAATLGRQTLHPSGRVGRGNAAHVIACPAGASLLCIATGRWQGPAA